MQKVPFHREFFDFGDVGDMIGDVSDAIGDVTGDVNIWRFQNSFLLLAQTK